MLGRKNRNPNQEIEEYRDLMQVPDQFEDGFTIKAVLGVISCVIPSPSRTDSRRMPI